VKLFSRSHDEERGTVDVKTVIESSIRMAWNEIRHRAQVIKEYGDVPKVDSNEARLGQVVLNLLVNAARAMAGGAREPERNQDHNEGGSPRARGHRSWRHGDGHLEGEHGTHLQPILHDQARGHRDGGWDCRSAIAW